MKINCINCYSSLTAYLKSPSLTHSTKELIDWREDWKDWSDSMEYSSTLWQTRARGRTCVVSRNEGGCMRADKPSVSLKYYKHDYRYITEKTFLKELYLLHCNLTLSTEQNYIPHRGMNYKEMTYLVFRRYQGH